MKILFVDDEPTTRLVARFTLNSLGHDCHTVSDGAQAWDAFRSEKPDVVISDWLMPGLTGPELCRNIRGGPADDYAYFILISALTAHEKVLEGMSAGADDYLVKPFNIDALQAKLVVAERVTALHSQLAHQRAELQELNHELTAVVRRDPLTGLANRKALQDDLDALQARVSRYGQRYCMAMIDVDHFKSYNDTYGHQAGDRVLQTIATQLKYHARLGDAIYRYGGEEFLCVFPEQSLEAGSQAVDRMRVGVERLAIPHSGAPAGHLTISAGLAVLDPAAIRSTADVLAEADGALYRAKYLGRNRVEGAVLPPAVSQ